MEAGSIDRSRLEPAPRSVWACGGLLLIAMLLGGGGSPAPLLELAIELVAALIFALWVLEGSGWQRVPGSAWLIAALALIVPLIQLVPLPPGLWQAMPGRELEREALALIGAERGWRPWSIAPDRTLASLLSLGPPLVVLIMTAALDRTGRIALLGIVCLTALLTLVVGALQLSGGPESSLRFFGPSDQVLLGFQANRNSTADLLLIALVAVPALVVELARRDRFPLSRTFVVTTSLAGMGLAALGVVLTASRAGIALLPIAIGAGTIILRGWLGLTPARLAATAAGGLLAIGAAVWMLWDSQLMFRLSARLDFGRELRPELWRDSVYVARQHFPWGVGMGDFVPAVLAGERLEVVRETLPNRAHNDYLELLVEAGIFGLAALTTIGVILAAAARKALRQSASGGGAITIFAIAALGLLAAHSAVDYPLRSMTLACLCAACAGMLIAPRDRWRPPPIQPDRTVNRK